MAHETCRQVDEWIEEQISRPVETWIESQRQQCRQNPCNWLCLCCNKWWCAFVTVVVAVVVWVLEKVLRLVTRTVCEFVATVIDFVVNVVAGLVGLVVALVRGDGAGALQALTRLFLDGIVKPWVDIARIRWGGDAADFVREEVNEARLKTHVRSLLRARFGGNAETLAAVASAISLDAGAFGLRLRCQVARVYLDSDRDRDAQGVPALVRWHEAGLIDLPLLAGFRPMDASRAHRPRTVDVSENLVWGATSDTDEPPEISRAQLDAYLAARGVAAALPAGFRFRVHGCSLATLRVKTETASLKARHLGLLLRWDVVDVAATAPGHVLHPGTEAGNRALLVDLLGRSTVATDAATTRAELCRPLAALTLQYTGCTTGAPSCLRGLASLAFAPAPCPSSADDIGASGYSGLSLRDNTMDLIWKYVLAHELGHGFGLCHVDGAHRIMLSTGAGKSPWSPWPLTELYLSAEPRFTVGEAMRVWDYIVAHFATGCLSRRPS